MYVQKYQTVSISLCTYSNRILSFAADAHRLLVPHQLACQFWEVNVCIIKLHTTFMIPIRLIQGVGVQLATTALSD